jgi:putative GTP pyrophosphokinase
MTPADIASTFNSNSGLYKALKEEIIFEITETLDKTEVKYHSVTARIKELSSLLLKVENKEISDPFSEVADIVGARVVALFLSDIEKIVKALQGCFDVYFVDNKIDDSDPRLFGYFSVHLHARIKKSNSGTRYDKIKKFGFEVQIRTIAMDAWASASHYLEYKSEEDIPSDLKRDFHALSGLYYVADKHFEMFFRSRQQAVIEVESLSERDEFFDQEINLDTMSAYLAQKYPDRPQAETSHISTLISSLKARNLHNLRELDNLLNEKAEFFEAMTAQLLPNGQGGLSSVGVVRLSLSDDPLFEPTRARPQLKSSPK